MSIEQCGNSTTAHYSLLKQFMDRRRYMTQSLRKEDNITMSTCLCHDDSIRVWSISPGRIKRKLIPLCKCIVPLSQRGGSVPKVLVLVVVNKQRSSVSRSSVKWAQDSNWIGMRRYHAYVEQPVRHQIVIWRGPVGKWTVALPRQVELP